MLKLFFMYNVCPLSLLPIFPFCSLLLWRKSYFHDQMLCTQLWNVFSQLYQASCDPSLCCVVVTVFIAGKTWSIHFYNTAYKNQILKLALLFLDPSISFCLSNSGPQGDWSPSQLP